MDEFVYPDDLHMRPNHLDTKVSRWVKFDYTPHNLHFTRCLKFGELRYLKGYWILSLSDMGPKTNADLWHKYDISNSVVSIVHTDS